MSGGVLDVADSATSGVPLAEAVVDAAEGIAELNTGAVIAGLGNVATSVGSIVEDPIGAFFASGVGWVIEHVPWLTYALDAVSGDEDAITTLADSWQEKVAAPLAAVAGDVRAASAATSSGWTGVDADAYRKATVDLAAGSAALGTAARATATGLSFANSLVLEVRTFIRDELSKLLVWTMATWAVSAAASVPTGGASVVAGTNTILMRAGLLAKKFAQVLEKLSTKLEGLADKFAVLGKAADALKRASTRIDDAGTAVTTAVENGVVVRTAFEIMDRGPGLSTATEVGVTAALSGAKVTGDAWKTWSGTRPA